MFMILVPYFMSPYEFVNAAVLFLSVFFNPVDAFLYHYTSQYCSV